MVPAFLFLARSPLPARIYHTGLILIRGGGIDDEHNAVWAQLFLGPYLHVLGLLISHLAQPLGDKLYHGLIDWACDQFPKYNLLIAVTNFNLQKVNLPNKMKDVMQDNEWITKWLEIIVHHMKLPECPLTASIRIM